MTTTIVQGFSGNPRGTFLYFRPHDDPLPSRYYRGRFFRLEEALTYTAKNGYKYTARERLISDGGTVGLFLHLVSTPFRDYLPAYLIHDQICADAEDLWNNGLHEQAKELRFEGDKLFLEILEFLGAGWLRRRLMYRGVRSASGF